MSHTFYLPPEQWGPHCCLQDQEARHLSQVLRIKAGEEVELLDGAGRQGLFRVDKVGKRETELSLLQEKFTPRPASLPIIALAWSKATRRGFFMEKAVELGVHEVWLWQGDHSQGRVPSDVKDGWHGQMIAGIKQCHNLWLPEVHVLPGGVGELAARAATADHKLLPWERQAAEKGGMSQASCSIPMLSPSMVGRPGTTVYVIGPEGGFSQKELDTFQAQSFSPVNLGDRVLRCETAALLCLGIHWWASHLHDAAGGTVGDA